MVRWCCVVVALVGCRTVSGEAVLSGIDGDGDGFVPVEAGGRDCDDGDATVNPEAQEICSDGIDNDCDGVADDVGEGEVPGYTDADGDGWGSGEVPDRMGCPEALAGLGLAASSDDCNDQEAAIHPGVDRDGCDRIDEDCDGAVDEDEVASWSGTSYVDADDAIAAALAAGGGEVGLCVSSSPFVLDRASVVDASLTLKALLDDEDAAVEVSPRASTSLFEVQGASLVVLQDLVVSGAERGAAIQLLDGAELRIERVVLRDNPGGAISSFSLVDHPPVYLDVADSELRGNGSTGEGGAISLVGVFEASIRDSVLADNAASYGGALSAAPVEGQSRVPVLELARTVVEDNTAEVAGGGLYVGAEMRFVEVTVRRNRAKWGGGLLLLDGTLESDGLSRVEENVAIVSKDVIDAGKGGGVFLDGASTIVDLLVLNNESIEGGGVASRSLLTPRTATVEGGLVSGNLALVGGGLRADLGSHLVARDVRVVANTATESGGGVLVGLGLGAGFESVRVDWGEEGSADDNAPQDVALVTGERYDYGDGQTFACYPNAGGCNPH